MKKWKYKETKKTLEKRLRRQAIENMKKEIVQEFQLWLIKQKGKSWQEEEKVSVKYLSKVFSRVCQENRNEEEKEDKGST